MCKSDCKIFILRNSNLSKIIEYISLKYFKLRFKQNFMASYLLIKISLFYLYLT